MMTVSAEVSVMPWPPARVDSRNTKGLPASAAPPPGAATQPSLLAALAAAPLPALAAASAAAAGDALREGFLSFAAMKRSMAAWRSLWLVSPAAAGSKHSTLKPAKLKPYDSFALVVKHAAEMC
jgi:hypothetical protein